MPTQSKAERILQPTREAIIHLRSNLLANALDLWNLEHEPNNFELFVSRDQDRITGHVSMFHAPEASYVAMASTNPQGVGALLDLMPRKCVLIIGPGLYDSIKDNIPSHVVYPNDIMVVTKGNETITNPELAVRLSVGDASEYLRFGTSFSVPQVPLEWAQERLAKDIVFGVFSDDSLASVASVAARLPEMAVIMGVETLQEFRGRGLATVVCSAATREALKSSESCELFVRSDNSAAIHVYEKLGYSKVGEELWIDIGTGLAP
jgi:ribosomal protein S18 acetylase RimI-like enzyme